MPDIERFVGETVPLSHKAVDGNTGLYSRATIFNGSPLPTAVAISWMFIWIEPSLVISTTVLSGRPNCAPIAAGRPKPIVPSPPELRNVRGSLYL